MFKKCLILFMSSAFLLVACQSPVYNQTEMNTADIKLKMKAAKCKEDKEAKPKPPLVMNQGMYVDTTPINLDRSPSWLQNRYYSSRRSIAILLL